MSTQGEDNLGTTAVREGYGFNEARLEAWLEAHIEGYQGPLSVRQFKGGQSNPTYRLDTPARSYVLRRKPPGVLLKGAHAVDREARVLTGLASAGYPVPRVFGLCTDEAVIGTWFYVMDMVEGRIFWDASVPEVDAAERSALFDAMNGALADLHNVDYVAAGLEDFGRPGNYLERQVSRWTKQYLADEDAGPDATLDKVIDWLNANMPSEQDARTSIVHGDMRIDNMIFHPTEPRVLAVLDWELATLGDPAVDFAYNAMMYRMPPHIVAGLAGEGLTRPGIPSEEEYLAAYCRRTGREGMPHYDYYVAFNFFRLAAIFHGIKGRYLRGNAASAQAKARVDVLPELIELTWQQTRRAAR
ncbi:phosphotransferase [Novosphingobium profundi]|uniref:phosphotransferase n=1 Tax=Novosphingobium profundi TaxID=1774954 RepID=UPI001CFEEA23|nr:phosphotransferase [Novosphingobium profundi]